MVFFQTALRRYNFLLNPPFSVGEEKVFRVMRVDAQKGFIDLSRNNAKLNEIIEYKQKFSKSKAVEGIIKKLSVNTKKSMEYLYKTIIWPLYKTHEHAYDALKALLNGDEQILEIFKTKDEIKEELIKILKEKLIAQPVKIRSDFELTCYSFEGIEAIKESLLNGEKRGTKDISIKFRIIGSPFYECSVVTINKKKDWKLWNLL